MTLDEAIRVRDRAAFSAPSQVDWARVEQAVEVIARAQVERETAQIRGIESRGTTHGYDVAARRGGIVAGGERRRVYRGRIVDENDHERRLECDEDRAPPGWARP